MKDFIRIYRDENIYLSYRDEEGCLLRISKG